jgi:hypothetical protein
MQSARAVFENTMSQTGYTSLCDFINAAVDDKVAALERTYNSGHPSGHGKFRKQAPVPPQS